MPLYTYCEAFIKSLPSLTTSSGFATGATSILSTPEIFSSCVTKETGTLAQTNLLDFEYCMFLDSKKLRSTLALFEFSGYNMTPTLSCKDKVPVLACDILFKSLALILPGCWAKEKLQDNIKHNRNEINFFFIIYVSAAGGIRRFIYKTPKTCCGACRFI
jgi:hypothetical protein